MGLNSRLRIEDRSRLRVGNELRTAVRPLTVTNSKLEAGEVERIMVTGSGLLANLPAGDYRGFGHW